VRKIKKKRYARFWSAVVTWFQGLFWSIQGFNKEIALRQEKSAQRSEAQLAVDSVVMRTSIAPDCVAALVFRGGCAIKVKHDEAWEMFIHNSYAEAAEKAIEWLLLQGDEVTTSKVSNLNRRDRRVFQKEKTKAESRRRRR
jgi:hypothetical protein